MVCSSGRTFKPSTVLNRDVQESPSSIAIDPVVDGQLPLVDRSFDFNDLTTRACPLSNDDLLVADEQYEEGVDKEIVPESIHSDHTHFQLVIERLQAQAETSSKHSESSDLDGQKDDAQSDHQPEQQNCQLDKEIDDSVDYSNQELHPLHDHAAKDEFSL